MAILWLLRALGAEEREDGRLRKTRHADGDIEWTLDSYKAHITYVDLFKRAKDGKKTCEVKCDTRRGDINS